MDDHLKTTDQLIAELTQLRERVAELETVQATRQRAEAEQEAVLETLRDSETRLRHITDNMLDVVGLTDLNGVYQYVSPSVKAVAGYEPAAIVGLTMFEHVHPDDLYHLTRISMQALRTGQTGRMELRYQHIDGHYVTLEAIGTPARDGTGRIIGGVMSARDITDRKQAEAALRESEERYRAVAYSAAEAIISADDAGMIVGWNRGAAAIFGYTAAEIIGQPLTNLLPVRYHAGHLAGMQRVQAGGERHIIGQTVELVGLRRDGREFLLELSLAEWVVKTRSFYTGIIRDISERKQAEQALRDSEARLRRAESVAHFGNWEFRLTEDKVQASAGARQIYGLQGDRWPIAAVQQLPLPEYRPLLDAALKNLIEHGQPYDIEFRIRHPIDGQLRDIHSIAEYDAAQRVVFGVISDITERKQTERAERDQRELADSLRDVANLLNSSLDFSTILDQMLTTIGRVVPHITANVMLIDEAAGVARVVRARGYGEQGHGFAEQVLHVALPLTLDNVRSMIATGQPVIINDVQSSPDWVITPETAWTRSYLGAPIVLRDQTLGLFNLDSDQPQFFTTEHAQRLMAFAAQAATAIENARLFEAERDARQLAEALRDTAAALNHSLNPDDVLNEILNMVERVVPGDGAKLMLVHGPVARVARVRGRLGPDRIDTEQHDIDATYNLRAMRDTGEPCILDYTRDDPRWHVQPGDEWIASYAGVPIRVHDELVGFLGLYSTQPGYFSARHTDRLRAFADQIALAIHNAQLHASIQRHAEELEERVQQRTRELVAANAQLTQLDQFKDQFISRISHELRTPLTNIKIYLELLETGKAEKRPKYLAILSAQTVRLQALIEDLLEVSQLDLPNLTLNRHPFDLNRVATDLLNDRLSDAHERGLTLVTRLQSGLPTVLGDSSLVFQAASRLIANALAYTPRGGSVTVITGAQRHADGDWITLTIQDTGSGISARDLPHIFERFYRGEAASDYTVPGTGLGLAISQTIIGKLGGKITVENVSEGGAVFTIWLPAEP